jgi:hypothetical protein
MTYFFKSRDGVSAHTLGRGVWVDKFGVFLFKTFKFAPKTIVFNVRDCGARFNVVESVVV